MRYQESQSNSPYLIINVFNYFFKVGPDVATSSSPSFILTRDRDAKRRLQNKVRLNGNLIRAFNNRLDKIGLLHISTTT